MPRCLASRVSCAAHSRTCATLPGADVQRLGVGGLDRVDDDDLGRLGADRRDDRLELDLGQQRDRRVDEAQPLRAQRDLLDRFLAGHVERLAARRRSRPRLQQQRRLADAGIAAQQDHAARRRGRRRARDRTPRRRWETAGFRCALDRAERRARRCALPATLWKRVGARRRDRLDQRVPGAAVRALALPLRALAAAFGAAVDGLRPWPRRSCASRTATRARRA